MTHAKRQIILVCLFMVGVLALNVVKAIPHHLTKPHHNKQKSYLFVLSSQRGALQKSKHGYVLSLRGVDPHVLWFTDRPNRQAGFIPTKQFIARWNKAFRGDPPNASLIHVDMSYNKAGRQQPVALELKKPHWSKRAKGTLKFRVRGLLQQLKKTTQLKKVTLFIDPLHINEISIKFR